MNIPATPVLTLAMQMGSQFNKDFIDSAIKEKEVLVGVASGNPFLISLHSAWHQQSNVFLVRTQLLQPVTHSVCSAWSLLKLAT